MRWSWMLCAAVLVFELLVLCTANTCNDLDLPCAPACDRDHGECVADHGNLSCRCDANWYGPSCSEFICDWDSAICENGGTCFEHPDNSSQYLCACPPYFLGENCQLQAQADVCSTQTCNGNGYCYGQGEDGYVCVCTGNHYGTDCQFVNDDGDPCLLDHVQNCYGHGTCMYASDGRHNCSCEEGYSSSHECEIIHLWRDICKTDVCQNGGTCSGILNNYSCECPAGFTGTNCTQRFDVCNGMCRNGGICTPMCGGHYFECTCPGNYTGQHCETFLEDPCDPLSPFCMTDPCDICSANTSSRCHVNDEQVAMCICKEGWGGQDCSVDITQCHRKDCPMDCAQLARDGSCDEHCNSPLCDYDGWDCLYVSSRHPWEQCPECQSLYMNNICDMHCNTVECFYDGGDCAPPLPSCEKEQQCLAQAGNRSCQPQCYTPECPYDGEDCLDNSESKFARGRLVMILFSELNKPFTSPWKESFLRSLSELINAIPVIEEVNILTRNELSEYDILYVPDDFLVYRVVMQLDISQCSVKCPDDAQDAAVLIEGAIGSGHPQFGPFVAQSASSSEESSPSTVIYGTIFVGVFLVVLVLLVVGVVIGKRRRITAKIWRPNSPSDPSSPSSEGAGGTNGVLTQGDLAHESKDISMEKGSKKAKMSNGNDKVAWVDSLSGTQNVVLGQRGRDCRQWGDAHMKDVGKLVQQYNKKLNGCPVNVDTPGPGGFTPLMLVVMRRPGALSSMNYQSRSSSESSSDDQTALIPFPSRGTPRHMMVPPVDSTVAVLIEAKANLDAVNDYNQTALHLAAACSRPEYVDQLIEAGANPNIQDNWGQSALHAAIGSGAEGAFMVLLNCSRTKFNLKSDGGITPLMAAVKMVNGFMVKQLLKKDSEIIASSDDEGRTAVHWAAMVDNVEALRMLVKCGSETIKDAQDNKGQTPLFLACREGSVMCVKHLIDCFANVTLLDNLEQSPMQIAMQKQYVDIVELLRSSSHGPLYMRPPNGFLPDVTTYPGSVHTTQLVTPPFSKKKKPKSTSCSYSSASNAHFHGKFFTSQVPYPAPSATPPSSHLQQQGDAMAMSELHLQQQGNGGPHQSSPTYPQPTASHSPPLPTHCNPYPSTSSHSHYSVATPTTVGYSDATPTNYDHRVVVSDDLVPSSTRHHSMMEGYPIYPSTADVGTHPLQHLPVVSEARVQSTYPPTSQHTLATNTDNVYSPPQSGGSQRSPQSAHHASPNSTYYGASPESLTPSPESRTIAAVGTVHGTVHVEPGYDYPAHTMYAQHFMGNTQVSQV